MKKSSSPTMSAKLSRDVSVGDYRRLEMEMDRKKIAAFIEARFVERYFTPLSKDKNKKSGFCTMAVCCLMIETLESFWQGLANTDGLAKRTFKQFFSRNREFHFTESEAEAFFKHVRCGILHQAETTAGWRVIRAGPLFESKTLTINATRFQNQVFDVLSKYRIGLEAEPWDGLIWINFRKKMDQICKNCEP